ncbi:MAG: hypothetical protein EOL93_06030, partial [Epsilonproteobacteria bacterium]|nr:hypothetical protein [Campylobacterota bacterium]
MEEKEKLSEVYKQLRHYCKADNLEQWAAENNRPIIDETIALIKEIVETGAETLLVSSELRKVQQSLANQEITQAEYDTNPYKQAFDKYAGKTFYQIRKLANVCLLQTILPLKKIPPYKKAADKAIKKAEVIIKRICKETNCNDETRLFLAEDLVRNVSYKAYIVYYPEKLIQHSEWFKEIALRINNVMAQITKPATDPKNDKYYNERDQLLNELEEGTRLYNNGIYQYNKADRIAADIISRLYPEQVIDQNIMRTERDNKLYFTLPSTSTTKIMKQILNNPTRVRTTKRGQIKQNKLLLTGDSTITYKGNDSTVTLTLERTRELFTKKIQNGAKVFNFFLQKLNEQHRREITTFQLSELVENGAYANKDSAYRGLKSILNKIYAISIEGIATEYNGRKKQEKAFAKSRIVSTFDVTYNSCHVSLTPIIRENMPYITLLPKWSYKLNENGYMLL